MFIVQAFSETYLIELICSFLVLQRMLMGDTGKTQVCTLIVQVSQVIGLIESIW